MRCCRRWASASGAARLVFLFIITFFDSSSFNKPSFCSGSCDEWHATVSFQKHNNLETLLQKLKTLETVFNHPWKTLETPLISPWNFLRRPWNFFETPLKLLLKLPGISMKSSWNPLGTCFKILWNFLETPSRHSSKLYQNNLEIIMKHFWNFLEKLP